MGERMIDRERGFTHSFPPDHVWKAEGPMIDLDPEKHKAMQNRLQEAEYLLKWALNWTGKKAFAKDGNLAYWREKATKWTEGK
jgi:hypothetical protein